ncbi:MAG: helix-turn-helix domain-containing protein [Blautia sp.]
MTRLWQGVCRQIQSHPQHFCHCRGNGGTRILHLCPPALNNSPPESLPKSVLRLLVRNARPDWRAFGCGISLTYQPEATLHEAAVNFGFYDEFHLSRAFKKHFKVSPSQFRKSHAVGRTSPLP